MSTEGGGGNKPKSLVSAQVGKQEELTGKTSREGDVLGETIVKESDSEAVALVASSASSATIKEATTKFSALTTQQKTISEKKSTQKSHIEDSEEPDIKSETKKIGVTQEIAESDIQVIAVSASKGPAAFFNLARKFLVTDEMCDLSALEGAIVTAVDAAHLLERSKLANIVKIQTSYVAVGPKRKKSSHATNSDNPSREMQHKKLPGEETYHTSGSSRISQHQTEGPGVKDPSPYSSSTTMAVEGGRHLRTTHTQTRAATGRTRDSTSGGKELRRARMIITVKRTDDYKKWLEEHPLQDIIAGDDVEQPSEPRSQHS